jgi:phosphinothricin acetyltransferase
MTQAPLAVRAAVAGDLAAITAIYAHHVESGVGTFELAAPDSNEMRRRWHDVVERGLPYVVATLPEDTGIAGYAYASPHRARPGYRHTVEDSVYVDPACVGRGVGRALLAALIAGCAPLGYRQMVAVIGGSDNAA